ncbi:MAG TPA: hypothetical protein VKT72_17175 [Candidatus Baltobacteraceae bacterium]|nr:hypothetical protein [Candidatus Baltobacteraceae bacterium]
MQTGSVSFERDIRPLFRPIDIEHMSGMDVPLDDYSFMSDKENAQNVLEYLNGKKQPQMPPGGPFWSEDQLSLFARWMEQGCRP